MSAEVDGESIPAIFENGWLKPVEPCNQGDGTCASRLAVERFRRGHLLTVEGRSAKNGERVSFTYSLRGYTRSATAINNLCGADAYWVTGSG